MQWDYIIVGAGSAGCTAAHELAKTGRRVLVLEAGGSDWSPYIKFPGSVFQAIARHDWGYKAQADASRHGIRESWFRGKVLGGSSSINGTKYVRAAAADFDRWAAKCGGLGGWSADEVMPIFREMESSDQLNSLRGKAGPLKVRTVKRPHAITKAFVSAACESGLPFNADYNGAAQEGVAYTQFSQRRGFRCSAADAFLKPQLHRKNIELLLHAEVEKIHCVNGRAVSVVFRRGNELRTESAGHIILCAGAINSPKILMLSGIGDAQELGRHDIGVVSDLSGVGRHFMDQPLLRLVYRTRRPTYNLTQGPLQKLRIAAEFMLHGEGPISNLFEAVAFLKSAPSEPVPDIRLTFLALAFLRTADGGSRLAPFPAVAVSVIKSYPLSSGRIRLHSSNPGDAPLIEYALLESQADVETLTRGVHLIRKIMHTAPMASQLESEVAPGADIDDPAALEAFIRKYTGVSYHSIGTCRMGVGADAVVDPDLRVRGIENLWVADASIMPDHISADTNATCMMIGMKLGKQLAAAR